MQKTRTIVQNNRPKIIISINTAWNIVNFRAGLVRAFLSAGYDVIAVAPPDDYVSSLLELGCHYVPMSMNNKGTHPGHDILLVLRYFLLLRRERPTVYLGYTVKPNIYGSLAAHALGIPVINNITGLGSVFIKGGWLKSFVKWLYSISLSRSRMVFFQNNDDRQLFLSGGLVSEIVTDVLPGSGIDLRKFSPVPLHVEGPVRFLLIARMLWDKGVGEFVKAARLLKQRGIDANFYLLGFLDVQNPAAISRQQMNDWVSEGVVHYLGVIDDVRVEIAKADCVVLPSYREGTPRTLLEAAAMGRPIITTDATGCREVVDHGINGYLCRPKDTADLSEKMQHIAEMSPDEREAMGSKGRVKVERQFDEQIVIKKYLQAIEVVLMTK